ncbi:MULTISPECIES: hypothetical protein [unclassified Okeania]|nr:MULTISPECIES: hypothetical protein [unclassified Okeania]
MERSLFGRESEADFCQVFGKKKEEGRRKKEEVDGDSNPNQF